MFSSIFLIKIDFYYLFIRLLVRNLLFFEFKHPVLFAVQILHHGHYITCIFEGGVLTIKEGTCIRMAYKNCKDIVKVWLFNTVKYIGDASAVWASPRPNCLTLWERLMLSCCSREHHHSHLIRWLGLGVCLFQLLIQHDG